MAEGWWKLLESYSWAEIGGVHLHGAPTDPAAPFRGLLLSTLTGWRGLSGGRGNNDPIPGEHGSYAQSKILRSERSLSLNGAAIGSDPEEAAFFLEQIESAVADQNVQLRVCDDTGVWSREVEVEAFQPADSWNRPRVPFTIDLVAPDPSRYRDPVSLGPVGVPSREGGLVLPSAFPWSFGTSVHPSMQIVNDGTVPVLPVVTLQGAANGVTAFVGPRRLEFGAFDGLLMFDARERRAWLNGSDVTRFMLRRDWPSVPAGGVQEFYFDAVDASADTVMTVEYRIGAW